jgi:hypothetical protein
LVWVGLTVLPLRVPLTMGLPFPPKRRQLVDGESRAARVTAFFYLRNHNSGQVLSFPVKYPSSSCTTASARKR